MVSRCGATGEIRTPDNRGTGSAFCQLNYGGMDRPLGPNRTGTHFLEGSYAKPLRHEGIEWRMVRAERLELSNELRLGKPRLPDFATPGYGNRSRRRDSNPRPPSYQEGALPGLSYDDAVRAGGLEPPGGMQSRRVWTCCVYQTSPHARGAVDAIRTRIVDGEGVVS